MDDIQKRLDEVIKELQQTLQEFQQKEFQQKLENGLISIKPTEFMCIDTNGEMTIYHVSLWEDYNNPDYPHISLLVTEVENIGDSIWKQTSRTVATSENTEDWPMLDHLFGSRRTWQDIIESLRDYLIATEPEIYLYEDNDDIFDYEDNEDE